MDHSRVTAIHPRKAVEGGRIAIHGADFPVDARLPHVRIADRVARVVFASSTRLEVIVPTGIGKSGAATVNVDGAASRARSPGGNTGNSFRAGFDATWELDIFGGARTAFAISMLVASYGAVQALISPAIGAVVDTHGYAPVCVAAAVLPLTAYFVLRFTRRLLR